MKISIEENVIICSGQPAGYLTGGKAVADSQFRSAELTGFLSRQREVREILWVSGIYSRMTTGQDKKPPTQAVPIKQRMM